MYSGMAKGIFRAEVMSNSEKIKPVALARSQGDPLTYSEGRLDSGALLSCWHIPAVQHLTTSAGGGTVGKGSPFTGPGKKRP